MLRYLAQGAPLLGLLVATLVGLFGHNLSQAWLARALGDPTAVRGGFGRVGRQQLDALGVVAVILTVSAWGFTAEVPIDTRPRHRGRAVASLLAGPLFLLAVTFGWAVLTGLGLPDFLDRASRYGELCSAGLFVTSMLPIPPLALGRAGWLYAPRSGGWSQARYRLEHDNLGRFVAFAILMIPVVFAAFPDVVAEFADPLYRHLTAAFAGG